MSSAKPSRSDNLNEVRRALLALHKALLTHEQVRYEQIRGRFNSPGELLQLVIRDPWFAWLRPLSGLIVQIDEFLADEEESGTTAAALLAEASRLLLPEEDGTDFPREYQRALQESPEVVLAHAEWKRYAPKRKQA